MQVCACLFNTVRGFNATANRQVVNAVFVQQTMKTASSDEELAFKQKEKDIAAHLWQHFLMGFSSARPGHCFR